MRRTLRMRSINRRSFLKSTSGLLALASIDLAHLGCTDTGHMQSPDHLALGRPPRGANERINIGIIGMGGRGGSHLDGFNTPANCRIVQICDPDTAREKPSIDRYHKNSGDAPDPQFVQDLRRMLDNRDVDAVTIAAPNHWHALAASWAMQAGKDVYVEKPLSHSLSEGRRVVQIAQRTRMICQC